MRTELTNAPARVAMITEGTYPFARGGVSKWCDQLIRSMPSTTFEVIAITAAKHPEPVDAVPGNLGDVTPVTLWSEQRPAVPIRKSTRDDFFDGWHTLVHAAVFEDSPQANSEAWRQLARPAVARALPRLLTHRASMAAVIDAFRKRRDAGTGTEIVPSFSDVVVACEHLSFQLMPLAHPVGGVDMTHATGNGLPVLVSLASRWRHGIPFLLSEHGVYLRERILALRTSSLTAGTRAVLLAILRSLVVTGYHEAAAIAPGNHYNRRWEEFLGARPSSIFTAYNGVDPSDLPLATSEPDHPTLVAVGRIDPLKDIETMIRAFAIVRAAIPAARLRLFGPTPAGNESYAEQCKRTAIDLAVHDAVSFEGVVDHVAAGYHAGHATMLSSISEGFPFSVLESLSCGRPVVATDVGGVPEAVGDAGFIVPAKDPEAMAKAAISLLRDEGLRRKMGAAGRNSVDSRFTLELAAAKMATLYQRTMASLDPDVEPSRSRIVVEPSARPALRAA